MKMSRWPRLLSLVVGISVLGAAASAPAQTTRTNKVLIYPNATDTIRDLNARGITNVRNYGSYWLAEATDAQLADLQARLGDRVGKANYLNVIELNACAVDTTVGEPHIPAGLRELSPQGRRLRLVQFGGPIQPEWLEKIKSSGKAKVLTYIPNNTYLVLCDETAERNLQEWLAPRGPIQWIGQYHPFYKIHPQLLDGSGGPVEVRISLAEDEAADATVHSIQQQAVRTVGDPTTYLNQRVLQVQISLANIETVARLPQVIWIEPVFPRRRQDEKQALLVASRTNQLPGHAPIAPLSGGQNYLDFLTNSAGFSTNPEQYPIVDVADSGLDNGSLQPYHPDFYELVNLGVADFIRSYNGCGVTLPRSRVAYNDLPDADGHGTFVASIVSGFNNNPNPESGTYLSLGERREFEIVIGVDEEGNPITECRAECVVLELPWSVDRVDADGFQLGMGINPFGRFGASAGGAEPSFLGPVGHARRVYQGRARISNNSWGEVLVVGGNDGAYGLLSQQYDALTRDALPTGEGSPPIPGPSPVNQELIYVFASGNANGVGAVGGFGDVLVTPPATGKNIITVGASENVRPDDGCTQFQSDSDNSYDIGFFSSFGATRDGRFKPDVVAPGVSIYGASSQFPSPASVRGCDPDNPTLPVTPPDVRCGSAIDVGGVCNPVGQPVQPIFGLYRCDSGTSFSAPTVTGASQLLWWWFQNYLRLLQPSPAMTRAYIVNSARYLPITNPLTGAQDTLPSIAQGMGMLDLERMFDGVVRVIRDQSPLRAIDTPLLTTNPVAQQTYFSKTGQSYELEGRVARGDAPFRVTLAWSDAPGNPNNFVQLVNNLELEVTIGGRLYKGNVFAGAHSVHTVGQFDDANNVESVFLPPGGPVTSGAPYRVVVRGFNIAGDGVPNVGSDLDQDFALVVYNSQTNSTLSDLPNLSINDACQTATELTAFPVVITNIINKTDYHNNHPSPSAARGGVEAFFKIETPTPGTTFSITTAGSAFSPVLSVWRVQTVPQTVFISGKCGALVEVISTNVPGNGNSALSFTADGSNTYYVVAEPFNNGNGGRLVLNVSASAPLISASPALLDFGEVMVGLVSEAKTVTFKNNSSVNVYVSDVAVTGDFAVDADGCTGSLIPPGGTCTIRVVFAPTATGALTGQLIITDDATGSPRIVELTGTGVAPAPLVCLSSSAAIVFTNTAVGELSMDSPKTLILTNCGQAVLNVTNVVITGSGSNDFAVVEDCQSGSPIAVDGTCTFSIQFTPVTNGTRTATLRIFSDAGPTPKTVTLQGTGFIRTPKVCLAATSLTFSNTVVGEVSDPVSVTITNCGTTNLVVTGVGLAGNHPGDFAVVGNTCSTLTTGQTCQITLTFNPTDGGNRTATLMITNNAPGSPHQVFLSGNALSSQPDGLIGRLNRLRFNRQGKAIGFVGQDIINTDASGQTLTNRVRRGSRTPVRNYVALRNTGTTPDAFLIQGPGDSNGFQIRYYLGTTTDVEITDEVTNGGFEAGRLAPAALTGDATFLRVDLFATTNAVRGTTNSFLVTATSVNDPAKQDAVQATVIAR